MICIFAVSSIRGPFKLKVSVLKLFCWNKMLYYCLFIIMYAIHIIFIRLEQIITKIVQHIWTTSPHLHVGLLSYKCQHYFIIVYKCPINGINTINVFTGRTWIENPDEVSLMWPSAKWNTSKAYSYNSYSYNSVVV